MINKKRIQGKKMAALVLSGAMTLTSAPVPGMEVVIAEDSENQERVVMEVQDAEGQENIGFAAIKMMKKLTANYFSCSVKISRTWI